jgi:isopentenyl-diphosphate delta-isomerase
MSEELILVDENDTQIGIMEKLTAHKLGVLHRAISILLFHPDGRILLQLRGKHKYHGGGRWTTTACSHPRVDESVDSAAARRLEEEMGIVCNLSKVHEFVYKTPVGVDIWEHEYLHVYFGMYDGLVHPNPEEADGYQWIEPHQLRFLLSQYSRWFSPWFRITIQELQDKWIYTLL